MVFKNENLKGLGIRKADTRLRAESLALASLPRPPPAGGIAPAGAFGGGWGGVPPLPKA